MIPERPVWWPVKVSVPLDGGGVEQQDFEARFVLIGDKAYQALVQKHGALQVDKPLLRQVFRRTDLQRIVIRCDRIAEQALTIRALCSQAQVV